MNAVTIVSKVENGNLVRNRVKLKEAVESFEGKEVTVTIKRKRKQRSNPQNAYYHGVIIPLMMDGIKNEWGEVWSHERTHDFLKMHLLYTEKINEETGEIARIPKSTTENSTVEQEEYHSKCREFMFDWFNITCPLPNEELKLEI